jgi:hypothetical protein
MEPATSLRLAGVDFVDALGRNQVSVVLTMFSRFIYCVKKFYIFYTFSTIGKNNFAKNCVAI